MKKLCVLAFALLAGIAGAAELKSAYEKQWKEVEAATAKGLPKTAIEKVEPILLAALQDKAYAEAIEGLRDPTREGGNLGQKLFEILVPE